MSNLDFKLRLDAEINPLKQKLAQAKDEAKQAGQNIQEGLAAKAESLAQAKKILGLSKEDDARQKIRELNDAYNLLRKNGNLTKSELKQATQAYKTELNSLNQTLEQSGHKMTPLASSIGKIGMAAAGAVGGLAALQKGLSDVLAATQEYQAIATRFTYAFDGAEEGAKQLAFVRDEAQRLGLEFMGAANGYAQFAAAAKDVNISTEQTQSIFTGVAAAAATMGLSADDANGVFLALSQIAGKGKVSMEELRGQLGERLAPAMSIAAKAMGVTTAELEKMVENGLAAETFLPRFGAALEEAFGKDAASNAQSLSGQINLLKNSYNELLVKLGEGSVGAGMVAVMKDIGAALEFAKAKFDEFSQSENGKLLQENFSQFYELIKEIGSTIFQVFQTAKDSIEDFASVFGSTISGSKNEMDLLQAVLDGANLTIAAMRDGVVAVGIEFEIFSGMAKHFLSFMAQGLSKITFGDWSASLKQAAADLRLAASDNYRQANEMAMNFESQTAKVWQSMADRANQTKEIAEQANQSVKESVDETAKAAAKTDELSQAYKDAQTAVSGFGLDMRAAMNEATPAMAEAQSNLAKLVAGFDDLQEKGVNASLLLNQALAKMTETATNQADIDALKQSIRDLGSAGKISFEEVERAILAADTRLQELKGNIDPTEAAFKKLGIQSRESLRLAAEETRLAFETVKASGNATAADLQAAFERTASALLATGDKNQQAWVTSQAAAYKYKVIVDEAGNANLQAAEKTAEAAKTQVAAHNEVAQAAASAGQISKNASDESAASSNRATESIRQQTTSTQKLSEAMGTVFEMLKGYPSAIIPIDMWNRAVDRTARLYQEVNSSIQEVNGSIEDGEGLANALAEAENVARENAKLLGQEKLTQLRDAIDDARQKMAQFAAEAANARKEAEKELLKAQGREDEIKKIEHNDKITALSKKKEEAEKLGGGAKSIADDYKKAIEATNQAFKERERREREKRDRERIAAQQREQERIAQQRQREFDRQQREYERQVRERERAEQQRQRELERQQRANSKQNLNAMANQSVDVHIDETELYAFINEIKSSSANTAVQTLFKQLQNAVARSR